MLKAELNIKRKTFSARNISMFKEGSLMQPLLQTFATVRKTNFL